MESVSEGARVPTSSASLSQVPTNSSRRAIVQRADFHALLDSLRARGYVVVGPTVRDHAIVLDELRSIDDLPIGFTDRQEAASYRLEQESNGAFFDFTVGPQSWKKFLHPPQLRLWQARRQEGGFQVMPETREVPKYAFVGVRSCELHAIAIQDKVFTGGAYVDPAYQQRRDQLCVVAVNCGHAGGTCFCASTNTGPKVTLDFDLCLTELIDAERHVFLVEVGTKRGATILRDVPHSDAGPEDIETAERLVANTAAHMGRTMDVAGLHDMLVTNTEHPRWEDVASRCLSCANCTMVCPTCFCSTVEDTTDLAGERAERWRRWDSCFTADFSYIYGGSIRSSVRSRYRQWMTHKLATWVDQFGTLGCVGCGRCITWCPAGIDITEEVRAIRSGQSPAVALTKEDS